MKKIRPFLLIALMSGVAAPVAAQRDDSAWTIRGGTFAGRAVTLNVDLASRRNSKFLRISKLKGDSRFVAWSPSRLPAPVAFRAGRGISTADSIAFWSILREMESDMGMRLFEPATLGEDSDPGDVIVVDTKSMANSDGMTLVTWSSPGGIYDARVFVRSVATLHNARVVAHEMMHALGFGHTSAWTSIMNSGAVSPTRLTLDDVAYAQYAFEQRDGNDRSDMWERLALAMDREAPKEEKLIGYEPCPDIFSNPDDGTTMKLRDFAVLSALSAAAACTKGETKGPDTLAVPAAAVDTTTDRNAGNTPRAGAAPATGVDTPITRKIGSPAPVKK